MSAENPAPSTTTPKTGEVIPPQTKSLPLVAPDESNALLEGLQGIWQNIKSGNVGNRLVLLVILGAAVIAAAWWFLARSSLQADSALWTLYEGSRGTIGLQGFVDTPTAAKTEAAKIARVNLVRDKANEALRQLTGKTLQVRRAATVDAEAARSELEKLAEEFPKDRTIQASIYLAAADVELALIGIRAEKSDPLEYFKNPQTGSIGQVSRYAGLLKKAAEAIGTNTDAGKKSVAKADQALKDEAELYKSCSDLHTKFYDPDPAPKLTPSELEKLGSPN